MDYKQELQKEARSNENVVLLKDDENLMGEKSKYIMCSGDGWNDKKPDGDHKEKATKVCGQCSKKGGTQETCASRKDQWKEATGKKKIDLHGGTGVGFGMQCG